MNKVEMHDAYMWDCPHCGRENFQRAVTAFLDPDDAADAMTIRDMYGEEPQPRAMYRAATWPDTVTCKHCNVTFEPMGPNDDDEADDE